MSHPKPSSPSTKLKSAKEDRPFLTLPFFNCSPAAHLTADDYNGHTDSAPHYNGEWLGTEAEMHHFAIDRHQKGVNAGFVDGSVRKLRVKELWQQKWHRQFDTDAAAKRQWPDWMR